MDEAEFQRALQSVAADRSHGASELAQRCLSILSESAETAAAETTPQLQGMLRARCEAFRASRPSMAAIANLLGGWRDDIASLPPALDAARDIAKQAAVRIAADARGATDALVRHAADLIGRDKTVLTHSYSSAVWRVFERLQNQNVRAIVTESRPLYEGHRLAARLAGCSIPATLITDAQMAQAMESADLALAGADSVVADGSVVNKAGTALLALAARQRGRPFYVCCERYKWSADGMPPPVLEEMDPAELGAPGWPGVTVRNVYFDVTPASLVTGWITEDGFVKSPVGAAGG